LSVESSPAATPAPVRLAHSTMHTDDVAKAAAFPSQLFGWNVDSDSGRVDNYEH